MLVSQMLTKPGLRLLCKRFLANLPYSDHVARVSFQTIRQIAHRNDIALIQSLPLFSPPYDSGPDKTIARLAVQAANQTFPFLVRFIECTKAQPFSEPVSTKYRCHRLCHLQMSPGSGPGDRRACSSASAPPDRPGSIGGHTEIRGRLA